MDFATQKFFFFDRGGGGGKQFLCEVEVNTIYSTGLVKHCLMKFVSVPGTCGSMKSTHPLLLSLKSNVS